MPYRATHRQTVGRHRSGAPSPAPSRLGGRVLGDRSRMAVLGALLMSGMSVAGVSAASAAPGHTGTVSRSRPAPVAASGPVVETEAGTAAARALRIGAGAAAPGSATVADADADAEISAHIPSAVRGSAAIARKVRPRPVAVLPAAPAGRALWMNPLPTAAVTSCFGMRWGRLHEGVDLAAPDHTPIVAAGAGTVVAAGPAEGYGNAVLIDHGNGFLTHYGHLSVVVVTVGQKVVAGQPIGDEGSTGHSTGPHLHFEVHQGFYKNPIEPTQWMHEHGVDIPGCVTFTAPAPAAAK